MPATTAGRIYRLILKEGGYEAQSSLLYYGYYGPFRGRIEELLVKQMTDMVSATRTR